MSDATIPSGGTRKRLDHIDAMRPLKQFAVISTHALLFLVPATLTQQNLLIGTHFSREAFLFVSACMLTYSYRNLDHFNLAHYWKRRWWSVGVPYFTWTAIYFVYLNTFTLKGMLPNYQWSSTPFWSWESLRHLWLLTSQGFYHLYYLLVILQFYVVFPFLLRLAHRFRKYHGRILIAIAVLHSVYAAAFLSIYNFLTSIHLLPHGPSGFWQSRLFLSYLPFLVGGLFVALRLDEFHEWVLRRKFLIPALTVSAYGVALVANTFTTPTWWDRILAPGYDPFGFITLPYNVGAVLCIYLLGVWLVAPRRSNFTRRAVNVGSDGAYGIYLAQMMWIPIITILSQRYFGGVMWPIRAVAGVLIVYSLGLVLSALAARTPFARALAGRSPIPWRTPFVRRASQGPLDATETD